MWDKQVNLGQNHRKTNECQVNGVSEVIGVIGINEVIGVNKVNGVNAIIAIIGVKGVIEVNGVWTNKKKENSSGVIEVNGLIGYKISCIGARIIRHLGFAHSLLLLLLLLFLPLHFF